MEKPAADLKNIYSYVKNVNTEYPVSIADQYIEYDKKDNVSRTHTNKIVKII